MVGWLDGWLFGCRLTAFHLFTLSLVQVTTLEPLQPRQAKPDLYSFSEVSAFESRPIATENDRSAAPRKYHYLRIGAVDRRAYEAALQRVSVGAAAAGNRGVPSYSNAFAMPSSSSLGFSGYSNPACAPGNLISASSTAASARL